MDDAASSPAKRARRRRRRRRGPGQSAAQIGAPALTLGGLLSSTLAGHDKQAASVRDPNLFKPHGFAKAPAIPKGGSSRFRIKPASAEQQDSHGGVPGSGPKVVVQSRRRKRASPVAIDMLRERLNRWATNNPEAMSAALEHFAGRPVDSRMCQELSEYMAGVDRTDSKQIAKVVACLLHYGGLTRSTNVSAVRSIVPWIPAAGSEQHDAVPHHPSATYRVGSVDIEVAAAASSDPMKPAGTKSTRGVLAASNKLSLHLPAPVIRLESEALIAAVQGVSSARPPCATVRLVHAGQSTAITAPTAPCLSPGASAESPGSASGGPAMDPEPSTGEELSIQMPLHAPLLAAPLPPPQVRLRCPHQLSAALDAAVEAMLRRVRRLQWRAEQRDLAAARLKPRYVAGLRQACSAVRTGRALLVVLAPNTKGGDGRGVIGSGPGDGAEKTGTNAGSGPGDGAEKTGAASGAGASDPIHASPGADPGPSKQPPLATGGMDGRVRALVQSIAAAQKDEAAAAAYALSTDKGRAAALRRGTECICALSTKRIARALQDAGGGRHAGDTAGGKSGGGRHAGDAAGGKSKRGSRRRSGPEHVSAVAVLSEQQLGALPQVVRALARALAVGGGGHTDAGGPGAPVGLWVHHKL